MVLKEFEKLMKLEQGRDFDFLDRNFVEKLDALTFRQEMVKLMRLNPEIKTQYYEKEDGLMVGVYFKNPPGRLLRRQWQSPCRVMPDFRTWRKHLKG